MQLLEFWLRIEEVAGSVGGMHVGLRTSLQLLRQSGGDQLLAAVCVAMHA